MVPIKDIEDTNVEVLCFLSPESLKHFPTSYVAKFPLARIAPKTSDGKFQNTIPVEGLNFGVFRFHLVSRSFTRDNYLSDQTNPAITPEISFGTLPTRKESIVSVRIFLCFKEEER